MFCPNKEKEIKDKNIEITTKATGSLEGIIKCNVPRPMIAIIGYYNTVYYGVLERFIIIVPLNSEIGEEVIKGKGWKIIYRHGDPYNPASAKIIKN